ncbi:putative short-chain dehydrogenase/reductase SDR [Emiliania huxleyi CCMP1516]|uniref:Uncharacterized protein n=2 Tax=Emiliania huxleyi TaxID=2903 RepID=A0A0D3IQH6_EMIH1|nr:putative short-chain dehydrogenase/reductase SDR [Emiliania huxleyi CCMP1516]EOD13511.1 putative short-chain dehydrogenase/reductase SDR [Emiliania huxleyi CCMP1516]|eukprot:XP_005765940.1 putative short-chain dehydrogenase/reductase SDR [Emiliania huxleyi CCMP1516]
MALTLAKAGASVGLVARRKSQLDEVASDIAALGGKAHAVTLDVTQVSAIDPVLAEVEASLGPIDVLVNNAGLSLDEKALQVEEAAYDTVLGVNTRAPFFLAQAVARRMVAEKRPGSIVNIASLISLKVVNNLATYAMSKAALDHMTRALAKEWIRHGIRVNSIQPGYIRTEINSEFFDSPAGLEFISRMPNKRLGEPSDLDGPLLLLASEASKGMTGACLLVDDGQINSKI